MDLASSFSSNRNNGSEHNNGNSDSNNSKKRNRSLFDTSTTPDFFPGFVGSSFYSKEWTQEEKDSLIAFANKYIIKGSFGGDNNRKKEEEEEGKVSNTKEEMRKSDGSGKKRKTL